MSVMFKTISYKSFGKCMEIKNRAVTVIVTLDFGPRVIFYGFNNGENLFREDENRESFSAGEEFDRYYYPGAAWYHYGGHRLWCAPEKNPQTYYPDNQPVSWTVKDNSIFISAPAQIQNNVTLFVTLTLEPNSSRLLIEHMIKNVSKNKMRLAPWTVTQMAPEGTALIPLPQFKEAALYPRQSIMLWDNTAICDKRFSWFEDYLSVRHDLKNPKEIKLGFNNTGGKAFYVKGKSLLTLSFPFRENLCYPDRGCSFELYCCDKFCELESLGEEKDLWPGDYASHSISFSLEKVENLEVALNKIKIKRGIDDENY